MSNLKNTLVLITKYIIIMLVLYFIYYGYNKIVESQKNAPILVKNTHNGKLPLNLDYKPLSIDGNGYSLMFWMKLTDPSWNANKWRHVLHKGHTKVGREAQPGIWLEPKTNNMIIRYKTSQKIGLYDVEPNRILNSFHTLNKEYVKAKRAYENSNNDTTLQETMNARDQDITDRFAEYTDKTVGELKEIDKINGRGGIFFQAREEEIRGDIDNFKPTRAYVWKPVFENNMPRNVHSIDEITAELPPHNDGRAAGYKEGQKIPVTLIFRGINSISPDDTVPQCKSQLTLKECCDRVPSGSCVKGCPMDDFTDRNMCPPATNDWIDYEKHYNDNCRITQSTGSNSNCVSCNGSGSGNFKVKIVNGTKFMEYKKPQGNNPSCFIKTDSCTGITGKKACHNSNTVGGKVVNDDRNFSTHVKNIPINRWFHVSIGVDDQAASVHIDGKLVSSSAFPNSVIDNDGQLWLTQNGGFGGHLTQVRAYNKVVSQETINEVYEMGPEPAFQFPDINTKVKELTGRIPKPKIQVEWE